MLDIEHTPLLIAGGVSSHVTRRLW